MPIEKMPLAFNSKLKKTIIIKSAEEVELAFHARYCAKGKKCRYIINNSFCGSAIYKDLEYHMPIKLDVMKMQEAIQYFVGEHDFAAFKSSGTSSKSSVRKITEAEIRQQGDRIIIELTGTGFLYNMVRIISGTLMEVGLRKNRAKRNPQYYRRKR